MHFAMSYGDNGLKVESAGKVLLVGSADPDGKTILFEEIGNLPLLPETLAAQAEEIHCVWVPALACSISIIRLDRLFHSPGNGIIIGPFLSPKDLMIVEAKGLKKPESERAEPISQEGRPICPECGQPAFCLHQCVSAGGYYDEYALICPGCGLIERPAGILAGNDGHDRNHCPFCGGANFRHP
jgi:hypothetical protein